MAWYPLVSSWMQEADSPGRSPVDAYLATQALVEPILISRFKSYNVQFYDTDVDDCRDKILDRLERRLAEPMEFKVKLAPSIDERMQMISLAPSALHAVLAIAVGPEPTPFGYRVRLSTAGLQIWEQEYPDYLREIDGILVEHSCT